MKEKNVAKKQLEEYPDVFADIVNVFLFNGDLIVKPEELENIPIPSHLTRDNREHQVTQIWKKGHIQFSYLAFERPVNFSKYIPFRSMEYDGVIYGDALKKAEKPSDFYPVVNLVLYFGFEYRWKAPLSLQGCFKIPKQLTSYLSDYKTNLFEVAWLEEETISKFQSDFRFIVDYYTQARKNNYWEPIYGEADHINEVFELLADVTDDERFLIVLEEPRLGGNSTMPSIILDRIEHRGMMMGRDDGLITGREYGKEDLAKILLKNGKVSIQDIQEATGWNENAVKKLLLDDNVDPFAGMKKRVLK